jgi:glycosyltransferase involved in cell wall biosynthesis
MNRIIAFTKDWNDVPTCTTHILREMGKTMPVLWINSIGMRRPQLSSGKDIRRIFRKLAGAMRSAELKENQLRVLAPLALPKAETQTVRTLNRWLLRTGVQRALRTMGDGPLEVWSFVPNAVDYIDAFGKAKVIYYGVDDWSKFPGIDREWVLRCEQRFLDRADVLFVSSRVLEDRWRAVAGNRVHYMPHGVWHAKFAAALSHDLPIPTDLEQIRQSGQQSPVIGFYGNLYDWIDFELVDQLAAARPGWSFVMIGPERCDLSRWRQRPNVHFLGRREPEQLPAYCKGFDAAIIPYKLTDPRMESVNPIKLRELLAAGVPVVAADIPEVRGISQYVRTARSTEDYLTGLETFLTGNFNRAAISEERRTDDWPERVREIRRIVETAQ